MVVLNCYGTIEKPICLSDKLKLYISNFSSIGVEKWIAEWKSELIAELKQANKIDSIINDRYGLNRNQLLQLYNHIFPDDKETVRTVEKQIEKIADKMVCIYFNYQYSDMPMWDWTNNCFDGRLCENDYTEKILSLISFLSYDAEGKELFPQPSPFWIYSSNKDEQKRLFMYSNGKFDDYINALIDWGKLFDSFLLKENDFYQFDYLCNALFDEESYGEYKYIKLYSLCEMFLSYKGESKLDSLLPDYYELRFTKVQREDMVALLRQIRNKIAHGDFIHFQKKIEEYATKYLDGFFNYDYTEYSRQNWIIGHLCCELSDSLILIIHQLFYNRSKFIEKLGKA